VADVTDLTFGDPSLDHETAEKAWMYAEADFPWKLDDRRPCSWSSPWDWSSTSSRALVFAFATCGWVGVDRPPVAWRVRQLLVVLEPQTPAAGPERIDALAVAFLLWAYVSAIILMYGVEFTAAHARVRRGRADELPAAAASPDPG
jgi:hypothetical protein